VKPTQRDFLALETGEAYRSEICLNKGLFDYGLDAAGEYTIQAIITFRASEWLVDSDGPTVLEETAGWLTGLGYAIASGRLITDTVTVVLNE
jgi:hypothetical protein